MKSLKITYIILAITCSSCAEDWLDIKQDKSDVVPQTLDDMQALLDNSEVMSRNVTPNLPLIASDNPSLIEGQWETLPYENEKNAYIWEDVLDTDNYSHQWAILYQGIFVTNLVLEGLDKMESSEKDSGRWQHIRGQALFHRSWRFFLIAQVFCAPYDAGSAAEQLGIPLRLESDINLVSKRSSLQQSYEQILADATEAAELLDENSFIKTRPSKAAAYGFLARIYLQMNQYEAAGNHANTAITMHQELLDYASLDSLADNPFELFNEEVIWHMTMYVFNNAFYTVDEKLYNSYQSGDLRKATYFRDLEGGHHQFKGSYGGADGPFSGLAVDEMYLILAESEARLGNENYSREILNELLVTRWKENQYEPVSTDVELLQLIREERRKSLLYRGIRWMDLRRYNQDSELVMTLERRVNDQTFRLEPNSNKYAFPIPQEAIDRSGMEQNPR